MSLSYTLGMSMARQEGLFKTGSRAARNNNLGNICWDGPRGFAAAHGATHGDGGPNTPMAVFPTLAAGWSAQAALLLAPARFANDDSGPLRALVHGYCGARLEQIVYRYCPPEGAGNSLAGTEQYLRNLEIWMGCKRTDIITADKITPPAEGISLQAAAHVDAHMVSTIWNACCGAAATIVSRRFWRDVRHAWRRSHHHARRIHGVLTSRRDS